MKPLKTGLACLVFLWLALAGGCGKSDGVASGPPPTPAPAVTIGGAWDVWGATAGDIEWQDTQNPDGGKEARLFHDPRTGDEVRLAHWPIKASINETPASNVHIFNVAGTFALTMNDTSENIGPSGYALIPKGTKYTITCANAGKCIFFIHRSSEM